MVPSTFLPFWSADGATCFLGLSRARQRRGFWVRVWRSGTTERRHQMGLGPGCHHGSGGCLLCSGPNHLFQSSAWPGHSRGFLGKPASSAREHYLVRRFPPLPPG